MRPLPTSPRALTQPHTRPRLKPLTRALHGTLVCLFIGSAFPPDAAHAQTGSTAAPRAYDIPAGPLAAALDRFARAAGVNLSFDAARLAGVQTAGLQGSHGVEEGFAILLRGSGHVLGKTDAGYTLVPAPAAPRPAAQAAPASDKTLSAVTVTAALQQETASGPVGSFVARRSATGTKTDTPLHETPQSVTVVTREQIEAQDADTLTEAFDYAAGIYALGGGNVLSGTQFTVRGFNITGSQPLYVNGSKFPIGSITNPEETYLFERVELLKGPASILFGQAAPGGIINLVSKRPTAEPVREIQLQAGSFDRRQIAADFGGALSADGAWTYRVTGLLRDSKTMVEQIPDDRASLAAALNWRASADTSLTLLATRLKNTTLSNSGLPVDGTVLPNPNGRIARDLFPGEPGVDRFDARRNTLGYLLEHRFHDQLKLRQNALWYDTETDYGITSTARTTTAPLQRTVTRSYLGRLDKEHGLSVDTSLQANWTWGPTRHTALAGLDFSDTHFSRVQSSGTASPLHVFQPVYGTPVVIGAARTGSQSDDRQLGLYLQDQIRWDQWVVLLGTRRDRAENKARSISAAGVVSPSASDTAATTYRAGVLYLFDNGVAPYLSYAESFQPQGGTDFSGTRFVPTAGVQHEVGIKFEPPGYNAALTVAAYELTQQNVLTADPVNTSFSVQTGEVRSRGLEIEGRAGWGKQLDLVAAYARTDPKITRSNGVDLGRTLVSSPRYMASLFVDYRFGAGAFSGLGVAGGVRNIGSSFNVDNTVTVPAFTVFDLALRYQLPHWLLSLHVKNVFDKQYFTGCVVRCFPGDERNVTLTARYSW